MHLYALVGVCHMCTRDHLGRRGKKHVCIRWTDVFYYLFWVFVESTWMCFTDGIIFTNFPLLTAHVWFSFGDMKVRCACVIQLNYFGYVTGELSPVVSIISERSSAVCCSTKLRKAHTHPVVQQCHLGQLNKQLAHELDKNYNFILLHIVKNHQKQFRSKTYSLIFSPAILRFYATNYDSFALANKA